MACSGALFSVAPAETWALIPPKPLEPLRREFGVAHGVLDVLVPEVVLDRAGVVAVVRELVPAAVAEHVGMDGKPNADSSPVRARSLRNPAAVIGPPRSLANTYARRSGLPVPVSAAPAVPDPRNGWTLAVPRFTRFTWSIPPLRST